VVNTWEGRGFLNEAPGVPAYWDHFNPALALLVPLWAVWQDAKLFLLLQAICLASPAPLVFWIARAGGANGAAATAWSAAYLTLPAVGQLNLNCSYGWHPISCGLPLLFAAVGALLTRRYAAATALAILACSFEEAVLVAVACLAAALGLQAWLRKRTATPVESESPSRTPRVGLDVMLADRLPLTAWVAIWALATVLFLLIAHLAPFGKFQVDRFSNLGNSGLEIVLSPVVRPRAFWGQVLRLDSLAFLLALTVPLGVAHIVRGWRILLAGVFPLALLLAWKHPPATCIGFQYVTTLIPILVLAALSGATRRSSYSAAGLSALAAGLTAATFLGAWPWSCPTQTTVVAHTYRVGDHAPGENPRAQGTDANRLLCAAIAAIEQEECAVLASGRVAAHLLRARRLESVEQALVRWKDLCREAGAGRSAVEVFDWIVLDTREEFQQSIDKTAFVIQEAKRAGYATVQSAEGIVVLRKP
jgi:uncharacterized membrane protein